LLGLRENERIEIEQCETGIMLSAINSSRPERGYIWMIDSEAMILWSCCVGWTMENGKWKTDGWYS
jgi:hypothetical protein